MTHPRDPFIPDSADARSDRSDRTGELLERYLLARASGAVDDELLAFGKAHAPLIRTAELLRESWRSELAPGQLPVREEDVGVAQATLPLSGRSLIRRDVPKRETSWWSLRGARGIVTWVSAIALIGAVVMHGVPGMKRTAPGHAIRRIATVAGQMATVTLDDGTQVTLAPLSELRETSNGETRVVDLVGEAHFVVNDPAHRPLLVRSGNVTARVLGTTFTVRRYGDDMRTVVAVTDGKVNVVVGGPRRLSATLAAGDVGLATDSVIATTSLTDGTQYDGWMRGYVVFQEAPLTDVLATMHRWYGYDFQFADSALAGRSVTVVLNTKSPAEAFKTLKLILNVDLGFRGNVVTLKARQSNAAPARERGDTREFESPITGVGR